MMRTAVFCIVVLAQLSSTFAAPPTVVDERDRQVIETLLLDLLKDPKFAQNLLASDPGATIVLHARTPEKTGFIQPGQMHADVGDREIPEEVENDLRRRNSVSGDKADKYEAIAASFASLKFHEGIEVADLTKVWKEGNGGNGPFQTSHPEACGWVKAFLPGYSKDGTRALVRAMIGPSAHAASVTALFEKRDDRWVIIWREFSWYV